MRGLDDEHRSGAQSRSGVRNAPQRAAGGVYSATGGGFCAFGSVGLVGVVVNYAVLYLLAGMGGMNHVLAAVVRHGDRHPEQLRPQPPVDLQGPEVGRPLVWKLAARYNFFALGGLGLSVAVLAALTYFVGFGYLFANLFAIGAATLWNYAANYRWTWTTPITARTPEGKRD